MLNPRASGVFISANAQHVRVNPTGVETVAKLIVKAIDENSFLNANWKAASELHPVGTDPKDKEAANWCLFADAINFSFWSETDDETKGNSKLFSVTYKGKQYSGWYGCCAFINRALDNGIPFTDPEYLRQVSYDEMKKIFTGDDGSVIPMLAERRANLVETAEVLIEKFDGNFVNCIEEAGADAQKLLRIIVDNFPSFRDLAFYSNKSVSFLKRAQVLISDVFACLGIGSGFEALTMFADYRVPQVLAYFQALEYSLELKDLLRKRHLFPNGDQMEVEIRGCSIHAVELIVAAAKDMLKGNEKASLITAGGVDNFLWCYRRAHAKEMASIPFHRTRCIYY